MREELQKSKNTPSQPWGSDVLVAYIPKFDEYGIPVHDGGTSMVEIAFCPWCGTRLPGSKRDRWFDELQQRGIDPLSDHIPGEYQDESWYRLN
jgi:hypothetical protein